MPKRIDLTGQVFHRLTVVKCSGTANGHALWKCLCTCGEVCAVRACDLKSGNTMSCGCYKSEQAASHGMSDSSEYKIWDAMLQRCGNPKTQKYTAYGGRGITVCAEWSSFEQFYKDMGPRPSKDHSIDRIDNNGNYCKENCRWATRKEQQNNKRSNRMLTCKGETHALTQWAAELGISLDGLRWRLKQGWSDEDAVTIPVKSRNRKGG